MVVTSLLSQRSFSPCASSNTPSLFAPEPACEEAEEGYCQLCAAVCVIDRSGASKESYFYHIGKKAGSYS